MLNPYYVYGLVDPDKPDHIRYVGCTMRLQARLHDHLQESKTSRKSDKLTWIRSVVSRGRNVEVIVIHITYTFRQVRILERSTYLSLLAQGHQLTNIVYSYSYRPGPRTKGTVLLVMSPEARKLAAKTFAALSPLLRE